MFFCGGTLVPQPGFEPELPAVEERSLNHWTAGEVSVGSVATFLCMLPELEKHQGVAICSLHYCTCRPQTGPGTLPNPHTHTPMYTHTHTHTHPLCPTSWTLILFQSHRLDQSTNKEGALPRPQGRCSRGPQRSQSLLSPSPSPTQKSIVVPTPPTPIPRPSPAVILPVPQCCANTIRTH